MAIDVKIDSARIQKLFKLAPDELKRALLSVPIGTSTLTDESDR